MASPTSCPSVTGSAILQIALQHVGEKYVLGIQVPKDNANWKGPWDCTEFVSWSLFQAASILYGCDKDTGVPASADAYTGYWETRFAESWSAYKRGGGCVPVVRRTDSQRRSWTSNSGGSRHFTVAGPVMLVTIDIQGTMKYLAG